MHTALLVSLPNLEAATIAAATTNQQVSPTMINALGFDPQELQAVRKEQIQVLPFLFSGEAPSGPDGYWIGPIARRGGRPTGRLPHAVGASRAIATTAAVARRTALRAAV